MANKTYANLSVVTTTNDTDLVAVYPTGGPLKAIAWVNVVAKLVTDLTPSFLKISNNLSDLNSAGVARTNLGLGTSATVDTGTAEGDIPVLLTGGKTPISTLPGGYVTKTTTYSAVLADNGKLIDCSNTFTLTLPSASSVGETYSIDVRNSGTGVITIAPPSGTIDGASSITVNAGVTRTVRTDGTNYFTTPEGPQGWKLIEAKSFTSGTSKVYADIPQGYSELMFIADGIGGTPANQVELSISNDGTNYTGAYTIAGATANPQYGAVHFPNYTSAIGAIVIAAGEPTTSPSVTSSSTPNRVYRMAGGVKYLKLESGSGVTFNAGSGSLYAK